MTVSTPAQSEGKLLGRYFALNALALALFWFIPRDGWIHPLWQSAVGWVSAAVALAGVRRHRPGGAIGWRLIVAGMFIASCGTTVDFAAQNVLHMKGYPGLADGFWISLYVCLMAGLGVFAYRRAAFDDVGTTMLKTMLAVLVNLFVGVMAWEIVAWGTSSDERLSLANRLMFSAYPLADMIVLGIMVRLLLGRAIRNPALLMMLVALLCLSVGDLGWATYLRSGRNPSRLPQYLLESVTQISFILFGAAAQHPSMRHLTALPEEPIPPLGTFGWLTLLAAICTAPLVILLQAILDLVYAVTSI